MVDNAPLYNFPIFQIEVVGKEDLDLNIPPDYLVSLEHEKSTVGAGNRVTVNLFDSTWGFMDLLLARIRSTIGGSLRFRYRYGFHENLSQVYLAEVIKIKPGNVNVQGVDVIIEGTDQGVVEAFTRIAGGSGPSPLIYEGRISSIVGRIADTHGWQKDILPTEPVFETSGVSGQIEKRWCKGRMTDLEFLKFLTQFSRNTATPGRYKTWVETNGEGVTTLHFRPPQNARLYKTYTLMHDRMGEVISFEPSIDNLTTTIWGTSGFESLSRRLDTRQPQRSYVNAVTHQGSVALGSRIIIPPGAVSRHMMEGMDGDSLRTTVENYYAFLSEHVQTANMTIVGDKDINPDELISVIVMTPLGVRYFTSGIWRVNKVKNEIKGGNFTTDLELQRSQVDVGNIPPTAPVVTVR